jgi:putative DNA primase/helicase
VLSATETYFEDQDLFGQWLDDECDVESGNNHKWEARSALFECWSGYAKRHGERAGSSKAFAEAMRRRGLKPDKGAKGARRYLGVQLRVQVHSAWGDDRD